MHIRFGNVTHYIYFLPAYSRYLFPSLFFFPISTQSVHKNKQHFYSLVGLFNPLFFPFSFNFLVFLVWQSHTQKKTHSTQRNLVEQITDGRGSVRRRT